MAARTRTPPPVYSVDVLGTGNPRDFISQEELQLLTTLKSLDPITHEYGDKMLLLFLFSSSKDPKTALQLIFKNREWREKHGFTYTSGPSPSELNQEQLTKRFGYVVPGKVSRDGWAVVYLHSARMGMRQYPLEAHRSYMVWLFHQVVDGYEIAVHREGICYLHECSDLSTHTADVSVARAVLFSLQGVFPSRVRMILVVNAGAILRALTFVGRLLLRKKLLDRVKLIDGAHVLDYVDYPNLIRFYGGQLEDPYSGELPLPASSPKRAKSDSDSDSVDIEEILDERLRIDTDKRADTANTRAGPPPPPPPPVRSVRAEV